MVRHHPQSLVVKTRKSLLFAPFSFLLIILVLEMFNFLFFLYPLRSRKMNRGCAYSTLILALLVSACCSSLALERKNLNPFARPGARTLFADLKKALNLPQEVSAVRVHALSFFSCLFHTKGTPASPARVRSLQVFRRHDTRDHRI
jgi:hypothetical protein